MNYIICAIVICYNIISSLLIPKKSKNIILETINIHNKNLFIKDFKKLNVILIFINFVFTVLKIIYDANYLPDIILTICLLLSFLFYTLNNNVKKIKEYKVLMNNNSNILYAMIINLIINIVFIEEVISIKELYTLGYLNLIALIFIIANITRIGKFLKKYKGLIKYKASSKDYLEDIKTSLYIEGSLLLKHFGVGIVITLLLYVKLPYAYIVYILFVILGLLIVKSMIDKLRKDLKKISNDIYNMNLNPSKLEVANLKRRIYISKTVLLIILILATLSITSYLVGEIEFIMFAINVYFVVMYLVLKYKKDFIFAVMALEKEHIDKNKYSISINDKITETIDYKNKLLNLNLYKIIYIDKDKNIYISDIELYNIKDKHDDIEINVNSTNMNDYIVVEEEYY